MYGLVICTLLMQSSVFQGVIVSILEATALTAFAFLVATHLDPSKSILLTSGIFFFTAFLGMCCCCCSDRQPPQQREREHRKLASCFRYCEKFMNSPVVNFAACALQIGGLVGGVFLIFYSNEPRFEQWLQVDFLSTPWNYLLRVAVTVLVTAPLLSIIWSRLVQGLIFKFNFNPLHADLGSLEGRPGLPASRRGGEGHPHTSLLSWTHSCALLPSMPSLLVTQKCERVHQNSINTITHILNVILCIPGVPGIPMNECH